MYKGDGNGHIDFPEFCEFYLTLGFAEVSRQGVVSRP